MAMEQNPYESPKHVELERPHAPSKSKKATWFEYLVVAVIAGVVIFLLVPAVTQAERKAKDEREFHEKYRRDPEMGDYVLRDPAETSNE